MGRASQRKRYQRSIHLETRKVPVRVCAVCHARLDGATAIGYEPHERTLQDGDLSLCASCGAILLAIPGGFRVATQAELDTLDPTQRKLFTLMCQFRAQCEP